MASATTPVADPQRISGDLWLTPGEAMERLAIREWLFRRLVVTGQLQVVKLGHRTVRVPLSALEQLATVLPDPVHSRAELMRWRLADIPGMSATERDNEVLRIRIVLTFLEDDCVPPWLLRRLASLEAAQHQTRPASPAIRVGDWCGPVRLLPGQVP